MFYSTFWLFPVVVHLVAAAAEQYSRADFPADFVFGSSTSAYQYEGAAFEEGRTPSFWDTFAHSGGTNGANGDIACDGYHKYKDDIKLMHEMGLEAFRFSISWSRLIPNGRGPVNPMGLKYYNDFINQLTFYGIQPHVTLNHVDLPQSLIDEYGGWLSKNIVEDFTAYADICFREFGDRVSHWTSVNEANIFAFGGYSAGIIPPGRCSACRAGNSSTEPYIVAHNILLAHSAIAKLYKQKYQVNQKGYIGINIYGMRGAPYTNTREDILATQRFNDYFNAWFLSPLFFGDYPEIIKRYAAGKIPVFSENESKQLKGSSDFVGLNYYSLFTVKDDPSSTMNGGLLADIGVNLIYDGVIKLSGQIPIEPRGLNGMIETSEQIPIEPWGLNGMLEYLKQVYGNPPVYIHENGKMTQRNGSLIDTARVDYISAYIGATLDAIRNGSNTKGYMVWTFLDCLELLDGYDSSYGFYYVDLDDKDLKRYPKLSAFWFSDFLKDKRRAPAL